MKTERVLLQLLRAACKEAGGQSAFARTHGMRQQAVSLVLTGRRPPSPQVLAALGLERTTTTTATTYRRKASADAE
jgi:hypothetical protein